MIDGSYLVSAFFAGLCLGGLFFGGLWWTVRKAMTSKIPAFWFLGSLVVRSAIVLAAFYFIGNQHWQRLVVCLAGFVFARILVGFVKSSPVVTDQRSSLDQEVIHASEPR